MLSHATKKKLFMNYPKMSYDFRLLKYGNIIRQSRPYLFVTVSIIELLHCIRVLINLECFTRRPFYEKNWCKKSVILFQN